MGRKTCSHARSKFAPHALDVFLARLGAGQGEFGDELYDLWQADSELKKLATFAAGSPVAAQDVAALVSENVDEDIFAVTNAIADRNRPAAVAALVTYMDRIPGNDEKAKIISISGALPSSSAACSRCRDWLLSACQTAPLQRKLATALAASSSTKKIARQFSEAKLRAALQKLEILDVEMKTGSGPASLQFLMIVQSAIQ